MLPKCPACKQIVAFVRSSVVEVRGAAGTTAGHGVAYACPLCNALISVGIDPVALKADVVAEVLDPVRKMVQ